MVLLNPITPEEVKEINERLSREEEYYNKILNKPRVNENLWDTVNAGMDIIEKSPTLKHMFERIDDEYVNNQVDIHEETGNSDDAIDSNDK